MELFQKMNMAFSEEESGREGGRVGREGGWGVDGWVRASTQERALSGTRKVVELFQKMNMDFSEEESGRVLSLPPSLPPSISSSRSCSILFDFDSSILPPSLPPSLPPQS